MQQSWQQRPSPADTSRQNAAFARRRGLVCTLLLIAAASCVHQDRPAGIAAPALDAVDGGTTLEVAAQLAEADAGPIDAPLAADAAAAANAALPLSDAPDRGAAPFSLRAATGLDQLRSLDCLAQAIYHEARSETEAGQRAVAQVVLNRVRHPAYPASVCGVVYQGPMRAGGGCQFTFTCDGSLAKAPTGPAWATARRIAAEALSGHVYAPVGHATHYHTTQVFPHWAPRLVKSALIGSHIFYRFPGELGAPGAFRQGYAGGEPLPTPARFATRPQPRLQLAALDLPSSVQTDPAGPVSDQPDDLPRVRLTERGLPDSRVRDAWTNSGRPRSPLARPAEQSGTLDAGTTANPL